LNGSSGRRTRGAAKFVVGAFHVKARQTL
jgi:hypothetical protein